jgi:hypothetical protein
MKTGMNLRPDEYRLHRGTTEMKQLQELRHLFQHLDLAVWSAIFDPGTGFKPLTEVAKSALNYATKSSN